MLLCVCSQSCPPLCNLMDCSSPGFLCSWDFPGKNIGVGCHFLLQGIVPTQGSNPRLLHWQADSFITEPPKKPLWNFKIGIMYGVNYIFLITTPITSKFFVLFTFGRFFNHLRDHSPLSSHIFHIKYHAFQGSNLSIVCVWDQYT